MFFGVALIVVSRSCPHCNAKTNNLRPPRKTQPPSHGPEVAIPSVPPWVPPDGGTGDWPWREPNPIPPTFLPYWAASPATAPASSASRSSYFGPRRAMNCTASCSPAAVWPAGSACAILKDMRTGVMAAGADFRRTAYAVGW